MKRCSALFLLLLAAGASLWAAGAKHNSALFDFGIGWHGGLQFDTLFDNYRFFEMDSMVGMGELGEMLALVNLDKKVEINMREATSSIAIGMGIRQMFREQLGFGMNVGFFIPLRKSYPLEATVGTHSDSKKFSFGLDDFYFPLGGDVMAGLVYMPVRTFRWNLSLTHGFHLNFVNASTSKVGLAQIVLGLGTEISADFYFKRDFYLNCGVVLTYDFYSLVDSTINLAGRQVKYSRHGATAYLSCRPKIAIGYRMMEYYRR